MRAAIVACPCTRPASCCCPDGAPHSPLLLLQDMGQLKQRLVDWLLFWRSANWRHNQKPFLLLASAQTTLGVRTILQMVKNRLWGWLSTAPARNIQQEPRLQRAAMQWRALQRRHKQRRLAGREDSTSEQGPLQQGVSDGRLASGLTTLYQLGVETNQQLMQEVLQNEQVRGKHQGRCVLDKGCSEGLHQHDSAD